MTNNSSIGRVLSVFLTYQNIFHHNISLPESRKKTVETGIQIFYELQKYINPDLSIEIGAREAYFSQNMRTIFPKIEIIAYEGSPGAHSFFQQQNNYQDKNIKYINAIVSDKIGRTSFNIVEDMNEKEKVYGINGRNSLNDRHYKPGTFVYNEVEVASTTGDNVIRDSKAKNVTLWIDVEGAVKQVITGLENSLAQRKVASIYVELESREIWKGQWLSYDVISFLLDRGYIPIYKDDELLFQGNFIFIRDDLLIGDIFGMISEIFYKNAPATEGHLKSKIVAMRNSPYFSFLKKNVSHS